ncbi:TRAP-type C4-dicarboxylate transport system, substrate-binding protein [Desulfuromusa kysingii]|uniref:TRAP-type C4-dicarboxylate transport system, substrate-binding protein n=1 Tax=Desulfuromusa kysingii TaxID=37625 RepID=A0A1H3VVK0_9BACT|nr:TRAP transporter substrate-binding protein DctP [Desulfuromusa kysingii]SDZ78827.1 TRAP-type C4-dicarboxylate transport system, substrate-binding protein [Desulfuromusa kysingii]
MRKILVLLLTTMILSTGFAFAGAYTGPVVNAKLASEEIEGDFMTVWANKFADHMKEWSDGKIQFEIYPYGTLGATGDINELAQMGVVQAVFSDYAWISAFVPQAQVLALNYIFPTEQVPQVLDWMMKNGKMMPLMTQHFANNGLVPAAIMFEGWQWLSTQKPVTSLDEFNGTKIRVMGSKLLVEDYKSYGASPTPMSYGEVYSGLQMGLIDGQVNPLFAIYSMKFFEVQKYLTQLKSEPFIGIPSFNKDFFDSLTPEAQAEIHKFWSEAVVPAGEWITARNASDLEKMKKEKPSLIVNTLDDATIAQFKAKAETVYPLYVEIGGEGAQEMLDTLRADVAAAKKALGLK